MQTDCGWLKPRMHAFDDNTCRRHSRGTRSTFERCLVSKVPVEEKGGVWHLIGLRQVCGCSVSLSLSLSRTYMTCLRTEKSQFPTYRGDGVVTRRTTAHITGYLSYEEHTAVVAQTSAVASRLEEWHRSAQ